MPDHQRTSSGVAATPPRGWNSYNAYTWKVTEAQFLAECRAVAAQLLHAGYDTCVVDYLWFQDLDDGTQPAHRHTQQHASGDQDAVTRMHVDSYGRLQPAPDRWPSAWSATREPLGFAPVAEIVHGLGMRFGIHVMNGVSQAAVDQNSPILGGSGATASDVALPSSRCNWWHGMMDINVSTPAAHRYYDSLYRQFAEWGVDLIKLDCAFGIQDYRPHAIAAQSVALRRTGRPMIFSISPGQAATVAMARHVAPLVDMYHRFHRLPPPSRAFHHPLTSSTTLSRLPPPSHFHHPLLPPPSHALFHRLLTPSLTFGRYRVSGDVWDDFKNVSSSFGKAAELANASLIGAPGKEGGGTGRGACCSWPDLDMLPLGFITSPGSGKQPHRMSSLTPAEQRTLMTLWGIVRSPLMFGGSLIGLGGLDTSTRALLTNPRLLAINANSTGNRQVRYLAHPHKGGPPKHVVWAARGVPGSPSGAFDAYAGMLYVLFSPPLTPF